MNPNADRNLLFGILALQMDFLRRDELIAAMHAWVLDKDRVTEMAIDRHRESGRGSSRQVRRPTSPNTSMPSASTYQSHHSVPLRTFTAVRASASAASSSALSGDGRILHALAAR
jgi:hypothetical protein